MQLANRLRLLHFLRAVPEDVARHATKHGHLGAFHVHHHIPDDRLRHPLVDRFRYHNHHVIVINLGGLIYY